MSESLWLIERTYAKGHPAERREFWLGCTTGNLMADSFESAVTVWTTNALDAARFPVKNVADRLRLRYFHPESTVEVCEHLFGCGVEIAEGTKP